MLKNSLIAAVLAVGSLSTTVAYSEEVKELNFGIISTESTSNLKTLWNPFLADMEKETGIKINAFFAPDYAGVIEEPWLLVIACHSQGQPSKLS